MFSDNNKEDVESRKLAGLLQMVLVCHDNFQNQQTSSWKRNLSYLREKIKTDLIYQLGKKRKKEESKMILTLLSWEDDVSDLQMPALERCCRGKHEFSLK